MEDTIIKEQKSKIKELLKEFNIILILFVIFYLFFQIHYFKESPVVVLKMTIAHFYLFIVPGYALMLFLSEKLNKIVRLIIGLGIGYGVQPLLLYSINIITKTNIMKYNLYLSGLLIILGLVLYYFLNKVKDKNKEKDRGYEI